MNDFAILRFFPFITFSWKKKNKRILLYIVCHSPNRDKFFVELTLENLLSIGFLISPFASITFYSFSFSFSSISLFSSHYHKVFLYGKKRQWHDFFCSLDNHVIFILHSYLFLKKHLHLLHLLSTFIFFIIFSSSTLPSSYNFCWWLKTKKNEN